VVVLVVVACLSVPLAIQTASPQHQEFDEAAGWLVERADADDVVIVGDPRPESPHTYYLEAFEGRVVGADQAGRLDAEGVWLLYEPGVDGDRELARSLLGDDSRRVEAREWHLARVEHYRRAASENSRLSEILTRELEGSIILFLHFQEFHEAAGFVPVLNTTPFSGSWMRW
jgi:hypothetical protein